MVSGIRKKGISEVLSEMSAYLQKWAILAWLVAKLNVARVFLRTREAGR